MQFRPRLLRQLARLGLARDEISEELRLHLAMEAERLAAAGRNREDAERAALEAFGDVRAIELECRRIRGGAIEDIAFEIRSAIRTLAFDWRATSIAFAGLTIALALLAFAFSLFDSAFLKSLPYTGSDRMVRLWSSVPGTGPNARWGIAKGQFLFLERESRSYSSMGLYRFETVTARARPEERPATVTAMVTSEGTLGVLGIRPLLGQGISEGDNLADAPRVALLSYATWESLYNRNPRVVGQTLEVDGYTVRIAGVLPQGVTFPEEMEDAGFSAPGILLPLRLSPLDPPRNNHVYRAIALLRPGVGREAATQELRQLVARLPDAMPAAYPRSFMNSTRFGMELIPLESEVQSSSVISFFLMLAAAAFLLALACAVAWSAPARQPSERLSPFSTEIAILVAGASVLSLLLALALLRLSPHVLEAVSPGVHVLTPRAAAFTLFIAGIAATLLAALQNWKGSYNGAHKIAPAVAHAAISIALVVLAVMMVRDVRKLDATSLGFPAEGAVATQMHLPSTRYPSHEAVAAFDAALTRRLRSMDGVDAVGLTSTLPLAGFDGCSGVKAEGERVSRCVPVYFVSPGYLAALGVSVRGREAASNEEAVVSAAFARRTWPGVDPIGRTFSLSQSARPYQVVGVAADVRSRGFDRDPADDVYVPMTPVSGSKSWPPITNKAVVVRSSHVDTRVVRKLVVEAIRAVDGSVAPGVTRAMTEIVDGSTAHRDLPVLFVSITALAGIILCFASVRSVFRRQRVRIPHRVQPLQALTLHD